MSDSGDSDNTPDTIPASWQDTAPITSGEHRAPPAALEGRYLPEILLGQGGFSQVWRVRDVLLERSVAMKILCRRPLDTARFLAEARICAQLSHQAIVQIHDYGLLQDGRPYITMPVVAGRTLSAVIREARSGGHINTEQLRRLITHVRVVCDAVAYAHDRSLIHRDLKPSNVMVSHFNQVVVLDWGLARSVLVHPLGSDEPETEAGAAEDWHHTRSGQVKGTLPYLAPEQAWGWVDQIDQRTDVFALGGILFEVLTGEPPWGRSPQGALANARAGRVLQVPRQRPLPKPLVEICERALQLDPAHRYADAAQMAAAIAEWLEGLAALRQARRLVQQADDALVQIQQKRSRAAVHEAQAQRLLEGVPPEAPEERKHAGWAAQDQADQLRYEADRVERLRSQTLHTALSYAPGLEEAHARLADIYLQHHRQAEADGDRLAMDDYEARLRAHSRGRHEAYLRGVGRVTLTTQKSGSAGRGR